MLKEILSKIFNKKIELTYRPRLYLSEGLDVKKLPGLKRKIATGKGSCRLILLSEKEDENFDIVSPSQLKLKVWEDKTPVVAGIASDESEAYELVMKIIDDCRKSRGDLELKEYICSL